MFYPKDRFQYSSHRERKQRKILARTIFVVAVLASVGLTVFLVGRLRTGSENTASRSIEEERSLSDLWAAREYDAIIALCNERLSVDPMDAQALVFSGFASFYKGMSQIALEEKLPLLDASIVLLRKARLIQDHPYQAEVAYVLGKAYYQKGRYFADLAIEYIEQSLEKGYRGDDSYEYLGLAYSHLARYEQSTESFLKAAEKHPSDLLYLTLSQAFFQLERNGEAEEYLRKALDITEDESLEQKCRFLLGEIYLARKDLDLAEEQYRKILDLDPQSADAHFSLGELFQLKGDAVRARSEWRAALRIDPSHYGARLRLY